MPTRENQYACHDLSVWNIFNKRPKFTFAQSKHFPPKRNLLDKENNYFGMIPLFYTGEITMTVGRCTELEDLFAWTKVGHRKHPFLWVASPKLSSAPILKQIPVLARANPGNQHPSFYSESFRNLFITRGTECREWLVENITWQLVDSLHRNLANGNCPWLGEAGNLNENNVCKTDSPNF